MNDTPTVRFVSSPANAGNIAGARAYYDSADAPAGGDALADLRRIVVDHVYEWLDDLAASHSRIAETPSARAHHVWFGALGRLDARPWGSARIIKPLFFARAVLAWFDVNPAAAGLTVIGAPSATAAYLDEMADGAIRVMRPPESPATPAAQPSFLRKTAWAVKACLSVLRHHHGRPQCRPGSDRLVLLQPVINQPPETAHRYFFTDLLESPEAPDTTSVLIGTIPATARGGLSRMSKPDVVALFDGVSWGEALGALASAVRSATTLRRLFASAGECVIGGRRCRSFWADFADRLSDPGELFTSLLTERRLDLLMDIRPPRSILFPYEEKGVERAILRSARDRSVSTLGFAPHPQHRLAIAMRDVAGSSCPKPDAYAVCGDAYLDYLAGWGRKTNNAIAVWGSAKGTPLPRARSGNAETPVRILIALSHPEELRQFRSWLRLRPELAAMASFTLRPYRALGDDHFTHLIGEIQAAHPGIGQQSGPLAEEVRHYDAVAFCATSAGIEAVLLGALGMFIDLTDGFPINPCFDDPAPFLPASTPDALADRLQWLTGADAETMSRTHQAQLQAAGRIFGTPDPRAVLTSLNGI